MTSSAKVVRVLENRIQALADIVFFLDERGLILDCVSGDSLLHVHLVENIINKNIRDVPSANINNDFEHLLAMARDYGKIVSLEFSLNLSDKERWYDARLVLDSSSQFILSAREITKYKETEMRMERQIQRLSALRSIDLAIASGLELNLLLSILLDHVTETLHVDAASILLLDPELNELKFATGKGFHTNILQHTRLKPGQGYAGKAVLERKLIHIHDLTANKTEFEKSPLFPREKFVVYYGVPLVAKGRVLGVLEIFHRSSLQSDQVWLDFMNIISGQAAVAIDSALMFKELRKSNMELNMAYNVTIDAWSRTLDLRDKETEEHTRRVTDITLKLARNIGLDDSDLIHVQRGATLHDIGKVAIPDHILFKPGPLDKGEWETMRQHPQYAVELLSPVKYLERAVDIPHWHHEKWNGTGYPDKLGGEEIPVSARMFALVDVYDALTTDRPYRNAWSKQDALCYIKNQSGRHFDLNKMLFAISKISLAGILIQSSSQNFCI